MFAMSIGCKIIGFARQMLLANCFGTGDVVDAYIMAQSIPNILLGGLLVAFSSAYMPLFSIRYEQDGVIEANQYTSKVLVLLFWLSLSVAFVGGFFSLEIVQIAAPGLNQSTCLLASFYLKFTFGYTFFVATVGILSSYLQYQGAFTGQIFGDYIQNLFFVLFIWVGFVSGNYLLILGPFLGYAFRWMYLYVLAKKEGFRFSLNTRGLGDVLGEVLSYAFPVFVGTTAFEINAYVDKYLAANLASGSISALGYAHQMSEVLMALTITILATILYPKMLKAVSNKQMDKLKKYIYRGVELCAMISIPIFFGCIIFSHDIIRIIFERGVFSFESTTMTAKAYLFYSIGGFFLAESSFIIKVYYSLGDMKTPMICAVAGVLTNIIGDFALVEEMGLNGLAFATSLAAIVNAVMLFWFLWLRFQTVDFVTEGISIFKILIATLLSVGGGYMLYSMSWRIYAEKSDGMFCLIVVLSIFTYIVLLKQMRLKEIDNILRMLIHEKQ